MQGGEPQSVPTVSRLVPTTVKLAASVPDSVQHDPVKVGLVGDMTGVPIVPTTVPADEPGGKVVPDSGTEAIV